MEYIFDITEDLLRGGHYEYYIPSGYSRGRGKYYFSRIPGDTKEAKAMLVAERFNHFSYEVIDIDEFTIKVLPMLNSHPDKDKYDNAREMAIDMFGITFAPPFIEE